MKKASRTVHRRRTAGVGLALALGLAVVVISGQARAGLDQGPRASQLLIPAHARQAHTLDLTTVVKNNRHPFDIRFSWVHWWESSREAYFREALAAHQIERPQLADVSAAPPEASPPEANPPEADPPQADAADVAGALRDAVDDPNESVRAAAVIALARADPGAALDAVLGPRGKDGLRNSAVALIHDPSDVVRSPAWVALGLVGDEESRAYLFDHQPTQEYDAVARTVALGLLPGPINDRGAVDDPAVHQQLIHVLRDTSWPEARRMVLWALRTRGPGGAWAPADSSPDSPTIVPAAHTDAPAPAQIDRVILDRTDSVFLAGEAMLGLGDALPFDDGPLLRSIARVQQPGRSLPSGETFVGRPDRGITWSTDTDRLGQEWRSAALLALGRSPQPGDRRFDERLRRSLRRTAQRAGVKGRDDLSRGPALLALARQAPGDDDADLDAIKDVMDGRSLRHVRVQDPDSGEVTYQYKSLTEKDDEYRAFAALAAGRYLRRMNPRTAAAERWPLDLRPHEIDQQRRRLLRQLTDTLTNDREPIELRAACAVALGLTADRSQGDALAGAVQRDQPILSGFIAQGLGLLGDPRAGVLARALLRQVRRASLDDTPEQRATQPPTPLKQTLALRAAVDGASLVGGPEATEAVQRALEADDPWLQLGAAAAAHRMGAAVDAGRLVKQLRTTELGPQRRVFAAFALGKLGADPGRVGLSPLGWHNNYTMSFRGRSTLCICRMLGQQGTLQNPTWPIRRFQGYAQPFLYHNLLIR